MNPPPTDPESILAAAKEAIAANNKEEALRLVYSGVALPSSPNTRAVFGEILSRLGRLNEAERLFRETLAKEPDNPKALFGLSRIASVRQQHELALEFASRAYKLDSKSAFNRDWLAHCLSCVGRKHEAAELLSELVQESPNAELFSKLALVLKETHRDVEAIQAYRMAIETSPKPYEFMHLSLGHLLLQTGNPTSAVREAKAALEINPNSIGANHLLVDALLADNRSEEAEAHMRDLIKRFPNDSKTYATLGLRLIYQGRMQEAREILQKSIDVQPVQGFAYCNLAQNVKITESDRPMISQMESLLNNDAINESGRSYLLYGLGKAYQDLGDYERAMGHFDEANALAYKLKFGEAKFDQKAYAAQVDWTLRTFDRAFLEKHKDLGSQDDCPIFVVGMIRSGTTLTEQILSSHPEVASTGEQDFWPQRWPDAFPAGIFDSRKATALQDQYLALMKKLGKGAKHAVDKMPANYAHLGLIQLLLPRAKIVHVRRHPVDTCLSIYTTPNSSRNPFAHNKANIAFAYEQYLRFMEHWRKVLPTESLLEIQYEDLIANQESLTREMIAFCGLEWSDKCLRPEENDRRVVTPSVWQVRQKVYSSSVEKWRRYEPWLGELKRLLP